MTKGNAKKITIVIGLLTIITLLVFLGIRLTSNSETGKKDNDIVMDSDMKQDEPLVTVSHRESGIYRLGTYHYENGEFTRKEGEFIPWEELEKQGIVTVKDGELSTPWIDDYEEGLENILAQENIDGLVVLPEKITSIEESTFSNCNITEIILPDGLKDIKKCTFFECQMLEHITIPGSVRNIGESAFESCIRLKDITFGTGLEKIEENAFIRCSGLTGLEFPPGLREIGDNAFKNCRELSDVSNPDSLKRIGSAAFSGCKIDNLKIPDTVDEIGACAFLGVLHIEYNGSATYGNNDKFWGAKTMA